MANLRKEQPKCKYGSLCYRTNADHRREFWHAEDLPNARTNVPKQHIDDSESRDEDTNPVSFQPDLQGLKCTLTDGVDEEIDGAVEGELELDTGEWLKEIEINKVGSQDTTPTVGEPIIDSSTRKADAGVILLLIGLPGSGKSTFCNKLMSNAAQPWTRICQDIIAKGKRGTKKDCLRHSELALARKQSVIIDRCNIDKVQRLEFLQLAASLGVDAHAVVLNLPASVCIQRAVNRVEHEGGVEGGNSGSIINRMSRSRQLPLLSEGFSRITFCRTDIDIEKVIQQYRQLLPSKPLDPGVFGASVSKGKNALQLVLEKGSNQQYIGNVVGNGDQQVEKGRQKEPQANVVVTGISKQMQEGWLSSRSKATNTSDVSGGACLDDHGTGILAFPSISTSDFQFDHERASNVLVEVLSEFLLMDENSRLRLVLVDLTDSHMLSLVRRKALENGLDSLKFFTFVGDITKLRSSGGPACNIIANAANWRLKGGGGGVNAAIYKAAGPDLEHATKKVAQTLHPGTSVVVRLPESSPLYRQEGVTHVIHVLGPNMNAQRPNCLSGDYSEGCRILRKAYVTLFQNFSSTVQLHQRSESTNKINADIGAINQKPAKNAFTVLMQASKRNREVIDITPKRDKVRVTEEVAARAGRGTDVAVPLRVQDLAQSSAPENLKLQNSKAVPLQIETVTEKQHEVMGVTGFHQGDTKKESVTEKQDGFTGATSHSQGDIYNGKTWDSWALSLYKTAMHPEQHKDIVLQVTDDAVVVRDLYPKAKRHVLVVARRHGLDSLEDIRMEHLPVLQRMHSLGQEWAASFLKDDPSLSFRLGYHSVPSMRQVHLHVISQDFDSASLKNKKHWNSFTTPFFRDSLDVLDQLEGHGQVQISVKDAEYLLELELRCHRCRSAHPNLPRLKQHISTCKRPFPNPSYLITPESSTV